MKKVTYGLIVMNLIFLQGSWPKNGLDLAIIGLPSLWTWMKSIVRDIFIVFTSP